MTTIRQFGILLGALTLGLAVFSGGAQAQTTESFTATVEVSSTLSLSEVTPLDFGRVAMVVAAGDQPAATLSPNGTFAVDVSNGGNIVQLGTPTAGVYTVATGAATFTNISITFPGSTELTTPSPNTNGTFTVDTFTVGTLIAGSYSNPANAGACTGAINPTTGGTCEFMTNGSGEITVPLGARISVTVAGTPFIDGIYSGEFDLVADFN